MPPEKPADAPQAQEQPKQAQTFPFVNIDINQHGLVVTTHLTPFSALTSVITVDMLRQLWPQLKEVVRGQDKALQLIRHINNTKIN